MSKSQQIETLLRAAGVNTRRVQVIGRFVHIDTFEKHADLVTEVLTAAGFRARMAENGKHMDGFHGFWMVFAA